MQQVTELQNGLKENFTFRYVYIVVNRDPDICLRNKSKLSLTVGMGDLWFRTYKGIVVLSYTCSPQLTPQLGFIILT